MIDPFKTDSVNITGTGGFPAKTTRPKATTARCKGCSRPQGMAGGPPLDDVDDQVVQYADEEFANSDQVNFLAKFLDMLCDPGWKRFQKDLFCADGLL